MVFGSHAMTEPTAQDIENARLRQEIAERFRREYQDALALTEQAFGLGWVPAGKHSLVTHEESDRARREGGRAVATMSVVTARNAAGDARHFAVEDGVPREVPGWKEAFGSMLTEPDPNRTIEVRGERVHPHKFELHWSGFDGDYTPRTAVQLAEAREKRERKAEEKER